MSLLCDVLAGKVVARPPVWLMRQAGRYLPEYRKLRASHSLFTLFHEPELAVEATLMPLKRFPLDAAIVFSDLLVLAEVWGKKVVYPEEGGPYIEPPVLGGHELFAASQEQLLERLSYVFETIALLKPQLGVPLLGFCGAPFTMLCYLLGGGDFAATRVFMEHRREEFFALLDKVCATCTCYARLQHAQGADAVQIFDSWTHFLSKEEFKLFALPYWKRMREALSDVPLLFFSRSSSQYPELISEIQPNGISFDEGLPLEELRRRVPSGIAVQGNFSPKLLLEGTKEEVRKAALAMKQSVQGKQGIIFNLGHGVLPKTPLENVEEFLSTLS